MQRVAGFARCVAPDMPGYGGADKPEDFDFLQRPFRSLADAPNLSVANWHD
jgi:hypothetical protein